MFGIHAHLLPACDTYEGAIHIFEKAHQHARFEPGWRGLKDKRDTSKTVFKTADGTVRFRYHHTDLVSWAPDELRVATWSSRSSVDFTDRFLPAGVFARSKGGAMYIVQDGHYYAAGAGPIVFNKLGGEWVVDPKTVARHGEFVIDRKKAARVRKVLKPFMDWTASIDRLTNPGFRQARVMYHEVGRLLQDAFREGTLHEQHYPALRDSLVTHSATFLAECYVLAGAVTTSVAPLGQLPKKSPYQHAQSWRFI